MKVIDKPGKQATELRQAGLVSAALQLAAQGSPAEITTSDLAQAVGITQGAVFRHFASKEAVWLAVMDWVTSELMQRLQAAAVHASCAEAAAPTTPRPAPVLSALRAVFMAHIGFVTTHPGVPRILFQELQSPGDTALKARVCSLMQRYRQLLMQLLQQAQAEQRIAIDADLPAACVLFIGSVQGLVMQALLADDINAMVQHAPGVFDLYQRSLLAGAPLPLFEPESAS